MKTKTIFILNSLLFGLVVYFATKAVFGRIDLAPIFVVFFTIITLSVYIFLLIRKYRTIFVPEDKSKNVFFVYLLLLISFLFPAYKLTLLSFFYPSVGLEILVFLVVMIIVWSIIARYSVSDVLWKTVMIPILLLILLWASVYNAYFSFGSCYGVSCKYQYFYKDPSLCREYYPEVCYMETAIKYGDENFCENILLEKDLNRFSGSGGVTTVSQMVDRCKRWVNYFKSREYLGFSEVRSDINPFFINLSTSEPKE